MKEIHVPDAAVGTKAYVKDLAMEIVEAWMQDKHQYVFDTLTVSPFALSLAVYHLLPQDDRQKFVVRAIGFCKTQWVIEEYTF